MTILGAAQMPTVEAATPYYIIEGYSALPLVGKRCLTSWRIYQFKRAHITDVSWWKKNGWLKNVGIVCGAVSNNLVVIDLDGQAAVDLFLPAFGDLMAQTFTVRTGKGLHVYLHTDTMPANRKITLGSDHSGIEIRGEGQYVVAPPSIHPDTQEPYQIYVRKPVKRVNGLWDVQKWMDGLETPEKRDYEPKVERHEDKPSIVGGSNVVLRDRSGRMVKNPKAYAQSSLVSESERVSRASRGSQNQSLYQAAQRMGQFITMGLLTRSGVEMGLAHAARRWIDSDQSEHEILATIASGLNSQAGGDTRS